jgi:hypothetical protein
MLGWTRQGATMRSGRKLQLPNRYRFVATFLLFSARAKKERVKILNPILPVGKLQMQPVPGAGEGGAALRQARILAKFAEEKRQCAASFALRLRSP